MVHMSVDEYEAVRLIDAACYTQEACAAHMGVSRSTIQSIYDSARKKIAESIVDGKVLWIEGGEYLLCDGKAGGCGGGGCHRHRCGRGFPVESEEDSQAYETEMERNHENRDTGK